MIDLEPLRAFYYVARLGSTIAAARALRVSQPAISQRLKALQRQAKTQLLKRAGQKLVLTEEGRSLHEACRQAFEVLEQAEKGLGGKKQTLLGTVRIAALSEFSKAFVLPLLHRFRREHPGVQIHMVYRLPYEMSEMVSQQRADFAFGNQPFVGARLQSFPVFEEHILCVGPAPSRSFTLKDMESLSWLAYGDEDPLWEEFERRLGAQGVRLLEPQFRVADVESILNLATVGAGFALVPEHSLKLRPWKKRAIHKLPVAGLTKTIYMGRLKNPMPSASEAVWNFLISELKSRKLA